MNRGTEHVKRRWYAAAVPTAEREASVEDSVFGKVLPVLAALGGVLVTGVVELLKTTSTRKHETKVLFRAKLEALTGAVTDTVEWTDLLLRATTDDELRARNVPIPPRKVLALCLVYFPELMPQAEGLMRASLAFSDFLVSLPRGSQLSTVGALATTRDLQGYNLVTQDFRVARESLDVAIAAFALTHVRR
ncbi:MAG: hypothetical protein NTZ11_18355 [Gammaproteobacteria bacterium]|nr:hypothetical protein [Gammaproteobacteria bacterium]